MNVNLECAGLPTLWLMPRDAAAKAVTGHRASKDSTWRTFFLMDFQDVYRKITSIISELTPLLKQKSLPNHIYMTGALRKSL